MSNLSGRAIMIRMVNASTEILWTAGFFNERFPAPVSPLAWSMLGPLIEEIALRDPLRYLGYPAAESIPLTRLWHGHPYSNVLAFQILYKVFPESLLPEDSYRYFPEGDTGLRRKAPYPSSALSPRFLFSILRAFSSDPANFSPLHNHRKWTRYTSEHDRRVESIRARYGSLVQAGPEQVLAALAEANEAHRAFLRIHRWSLMHADLTFGLLKRLARAWIERERGDQIASRWVAGNVNKTMEVDADLRALGPDPDVGGNEFQRFITQHGHRSFSLDISVPTFADDPAQVIRLAKAMAGTSGAAQSPAKEEIAETLGRIPFWRRWILNAVRNLAARYVAMREDQRYYWQKSLAVSRHLYLMLADRLVESGVLALRDDVFYVTHDELADYWLGRMNREEFVGGLSRRKAEYEVYRREAADAPAGAYPPFLRNDMPLLPVALSLKTWRARAISPGTARGAARVVISASDLERVRRGEILVAPSTDPAWTPVFGMIAGLVLERGGVLSHGAVVAREYRIPAVAGIANIANEIHDGEMIQVDGNQGTVTRL